MRSVKIKFYSTPEKKSVWQKDHLFSVHLGNGTWKKFTSKKSCVLYLNKLSDHLTHKAHELNAIHSELYTSLRRMWFSLDTYLFMERSILDRLHSFEETLFKITSKHTDPSLGNAHVYALFRHAIKMLSSCCSEIETIYSKRNMHSECYGMRALQNRLLQVEREIFNYVLPADGEKEEESESNIFQDAG